MTTRQFGLHPAELKIVIENIQSRYAVIKNKYPSLDAQLIFAVGGANARIKAPLLTILETIPGFFADSDQKEMARTQLKLRNQLVKATASDNDLKKTSRAHLEQVNKTLEALVSTLEINFSVRVELLWDELDFDLIRKLRSDSLIDDKLTPNIGGIRTVLGTIYDFSEGWGHY